MESVRFDIQPELSEPVLLAAWPGVGDVALIAANYIVEKLEARAFAEIEPFDFFDAGGVFVKDNLIEAPKFPQGTFYSWHGDGAATDLIIFVGEAQPSHGSYKYVNKVLDVAQLFGVKRVYTIAAALTEHHPDPPRVLGAANSKELLDVLSQAGVMLAKDFYIAGLNGLLLGVASERDLESICLLGETVKYAAKMANPMAAREVLNILTRFLQISIDMKEIEELAESTDQQLRQVTAELKKDFLQHFTTPLWERQEQDENG